MALALLFILETVKKVTNRKFNTHFLAKSIGEDSEMEKKRHLPSLLLFSRLGAFDNERNQSWFIKALYKRAFQLASEPSKDPSMLKKANLSSSNAFSIRKTAETRFLLAPFVISVKVTKKVYHLGILVWYIPINNNK